MGVSTTVGDTKGKVQNGSDQAGDRLIGGRSYTKDEADTSAVRPVRRITSQGGQKAMFPAWFGVDYASCEG